MIKLYKKLSDKNKTVVKVTAVHFIFIFALLFQGINFSKPKKNNISVRTISINEPLKLVIKKTIEKPKNKVVTNNKPASKKVIKKTINTNKSILLERLEKELNKLDDSKNVTRNKSELSQPKKIDTLKALKEDKKEQPEYKQLLVSQIRQNLKLPEYGEVKISFVIDTDGRVENINILDSESLINQNYLKNSLTELQFSWFNEIFNEPQEFIVIFKND